MKPHRRSNKCLHIKHAVSRLLCHFPLSAEVLQDWVTVQRFECIPLPPAGCCQIPCGGKGAVQRSQANTGAPGCGGGGPLGAQTSLADRQAPAQAAWETLNPAQAAMKPRLQVLSLSMHLVSSFPP